MDIKFNYGSNNKNAALLLLLAVLLLSFAEIMILRRISAAESETVAKRIENSALQTSFSRKSEAMAYYKSNVKLDTNLVIEEADSPTKVYAYLLELLAESGIKDARVVKASDFEGSVCFNISGSDDYFAILNLLGVLRSSGKMHKITELTLLAQNDGKTSYSFTVASAVKQKDSSQKNGEEAKGEGEASQ